MISASFTEFVEKYTKPCPDPECPSCKTFGLRMYCPPDAPERVVCLNRNCPDYERLEGMPDPNWTRSLLSPCPPPDRPTD
ncbi:hypothetical protein [Streptomyces sparsogenes]|uniref:Uncharacterized protein n=1 Tax=Streptomyces sparsogenes DSM 40356 TaxID=1331668 RepID=A0A1R1S7Q2_9ACTN|nr:hypothetical protein [Streptomyces sparsogenes]OMI34346.1 hypothetical protein SPAR_36221 [Streptomyces sparsogenes DSM 40356]